MKAWLQERVRKAIFLSTEYGKIIFITVLGVISCISIYSILMVVSPSLFKISFLDVGQGDAILIQTPSGKSMLIDGGPTNSILERLGNSLSYFDNDIDIMLATHPDADHVTGLAPVLEKYKVDSVVISPVKSPTNIFDAVDKLIKKEEAVIHEAHEGDSIDFHDGVIAYVLSPKVGYQSYKNDTNDASVSVLVTYSGQSFLLTGDLPSTQERGLITTKLPRHITVYKAGHHGSKYSSGDELLSYITPEYAVISAGRGNRYGHPNNETLDRLREYGKETLSTIERGTIQFISDGYSLKIQTDK